MGSRRTYGLEIERLLESTLEEIVGEPLTATTKRFSLFDWESDSYCVELKSRTSQYSPEQFETWLLPACKADLQTHKHKVFFMYWSKTGELYRLDYDPEKFSSYKREAPFFSSQVHYFVPAAHWIKLEIPV